jgi:hypothetical protein
MNNELSINADKNVVSLDDKESDNYAAALKMVIGMTPVIGSILTEVVGVVVPDQKIERIKLFLEVLANKVKHIDRDVLEVKMKTEEFTDLFEDALHQAARALTDERREYIATFLKNSLSTDEAEHIGEKKLLSLLNQLNDIEIIILRGAALDVRKRQDFYELHRNALDTGLSNTYANREKLALRRSYDIKLDDLGLMEHNYERLQRRLPPEFDRTTGKLKLQNKKISPLGQMLVRYIDDSYSDDGY